MTFKTTAQAIAYFDALETAKGPSLGTNFTLRRVHRSIRPDTELIAFQSSPYVLLAHYGELDWVRELLPGHSPCHLADNIATGRSIWRRRRSCENERRTGRCKEPDGHSSPRLDSSRRRKPVIRVGLVFGIRHCERRYVPGTESNHLSWRVVGKILL